MTRLAVIASHPVQYYAPWFRRLATRDDWKVKVFYLWDTENQDKWDPGFQANVSWDIPLLEGYEFEFVKNLSTSPGTHHFRGLQNPGLTEAVKRWTPDAVLMLGFAFESMIAFIVHWPSRKVPLLIRGDSHYFFPPVSWKARCKELITKMLFKKFSAFLFCGKSNREYFLSRGARSEQLFFVPHGIDMDRFQASSGNKKAASNLREKLGIAQTEKLILFAGKLEEKKRPMDLLEAFRRIPTAGRRLAFAGSGPWEQTLREAVHGDERVVFIPFQNQSQMPALYAAADLFILPSLGPNETWGLAVQEALACETPVIVSSHVGCHPDLVHSGVNGLVFSAGSTADLASSLKIALEPGVIEKWRLGARAALKNYTYEEALKGLESSLSAISSQ